MSGKPHFASHLPSLNFFLRVLVPNIWLRPNNQRREADAAKALFTVPDGDHLTLLNVYNQYVLSKHFPSSPAGIAIKVCLSLDKHDKNWAWTNYLSLRALQQADNVRAQLQRNMERFDIDLISLQDENRLYLKIRQALVCGFFMQVAHKEGEKGNYLTVKDNQVSLGCCLSSAISPHRKIPLTGGCTTSVLRSGHPARMGYL